MCIGLIGWSQTVTIGAGVNAGTTGSNAGPIYRSSAGSAFDFSQQVYLYTAAELATAGILPGSTITSLAWNKSNAFGTAATNTVSIWRVYMKNSAAAPGASWSSTSFPTQVTGATLVYNNTAQAIPLVAGFITLTFGTPFVYTGGTLEIGSDWDCSLFAGSPATGGFAWRSDPLTNQVFGGSNSIATMTMALQTVRPQIELTYVAPAPCSGTPSPGSTVASAASVCPGANFTLSLSTTPAGSGVTYQWQTSPDNIAPYTDISGATSGALVTNQSAAAYYQCVATCTNSGFSGTSTPVQVNLIGTSLPWNENFDALGTIGTTNFPSCWVEEAGDWTTANAATDTYTDPRSAPNYLRTSWTTVANEFIWTPGFDLTGGTSYDFSTFYSTDGYDGWQIEIYTNSTPTSVGATLLGSTFNVPGNGNVPTGYSNFARTFIPGASGTYTFGVRIIQPSGAPWYLGLDDFKLEVTPSCSTPFDLAASNVLLTTADLNWTVNGIDSYEWEVRTSGAAGSGPAGLVTSGTSSTVPVNVSGLTASTTYTAYIRSVCAGPIYGSWSSGVNFSTGVPGQIGIGTATNTFMPIYSCYGYNYSQQIYLASEYNTPANTLIDKIRFYYDNGGAVTANWQDWVVYMGNTSQSSFASGTDWIPSASLTQVFSGTVTPVAGNWMEIIELALYLGWQQQHCRCCGREHTELQLHRCLALLQWWHEPRPAVLRRRYQPGSHGASCGQLRFPHEYAGADPAFRNGGCALRTACTW
ncbi:MAG: fibronectin type III domain-containing protein [Flavobacteriales bacterium]|nr:fibronectin type III domain-containing protein [Flavobacteriales bacterium]